MLFSMKLNNYGTEADNTSDMPFKQKEAGLQVATNHIDSFRVGQVEHVTFTRLAHDVYEVFHVFSVPEQY
jgi:hypothetical protein